MACPVGRNSRLSDNKRKMPDEERQRDRMSSPTREEMAFNQRLARNAPARAASNIQDRYMVTRREIQERLTVKGKITTIPKGTPCKPIRNSPGPMRYRVDPWPGISKAELAALQSMGVQVEAEDVENSQGPT